MCINELGESVGKFLQQKWRKHPEFEILTVKILLRVPTFGFMLILQKIANILISKGVSRQQELSVLT